MKNDCIEIHNFSVKGFYLLLMCTGVRTNEYPFQFAYLVRLNSFPDQTQNHLVKHNLTKFVSELVDPDVSNTRQTIGQLTQILRKYRNGTFRKTFLPGYTIIFPTCAAVDEFTLSMLLTSSIISLDPPCSRKRKIRTSL